MYVLIVMSIAACQSQQRISGIGVATLDVIELFSVARYS
jgi:hypothetical protein